MLTLDERYELQQLLGERGFRIGAPDGRIGAQTRFAIRDFQSSVGAIPDGFASSDVLDRLRQR
jgi:peptidoglycan hydrolase-like protein with peptidoglycan-binding domain